MEFLGWIDGNSLRSIAIRIQVDDCNGQVAGSAVAAAVYQAPDPSDGLRHNSARRHDITQFPERYPFYQAINQQGKPGAQHRPPDSQSSEVQ